MYTFLVTGCAGFIGSNLVSRLLEMGHRVVGLDNYSTGFSENLSLFMKHPQFKFFEGDICDISICEKACQGVDFVLHHAALGSVPRSIEQPLLYNENNITGTLNMLVAARDAKVKRFVFASSSSVYGDTPTLPKIESMHASPMTPYAVSKITGEYYCRIFFELYGLPTISLRYFNVFGPRQNPNSQYAAVIPKFITAFLQHESPTIFGDGEQTRDFTFVENVIQANLLSCEASQEAFGGAFNIGCGDRISLNLLAEIIKKQTQSSVEVQYASPRVGDVRDSLASIELATTLLGIKDRISLEEGLKHTIAWYQQALCS